MQSRSILTLSTMLVVVVLGCGDEPVSSACGPVPDEELEDCVIEFEGDFVDAEDLEILCDTRCTRFEGDISILGLEGVNDLRAFENVRAARAISVEYTKDLKTLQGIENIEFTNQMIGGRFENNAELRSIEAYNATSTPAGVTIRNNPKLESLRGLENVVEAGDVIIENNDSLKNFEGLENLTEARLVSATGNGALSSGEGLDSLAIIRERGSFNLIDNPKLVDLSTTLPAAESITQVVLRGNSSLEQCEVEAFVERVGPAETRIESNGPVCD